MKNKCNTKYKSCSCKQKKEKTTYKTTYRPKEENIRDILERKVNYGPTPDNTPLNHKCKHWGYSGTVYRYQCLTCIRSWVWAVGPEVAKEELVNFKDKTIAIERIERAIAEYKYASDILP